MVDTKKRGLLKREEVREEETWNLKDLFETDDAWFKELKKMGEDLTALQTFIGHLGESSKNLYEYLKWQDSFGLRFSMLAEYAMRKHDEDTSNATYLDMRGKFMNLYVQYASISAPITPELIAISDEVLEGFFKDCEELELYRRALAQIRHMKPHTLTDAEERILAAMSDVANASEDIAGVLRNADLKFPTVLDGNGNSIPLTSGNYISCVSSPDRVLRKNAFEAYYKVYEDHINTFAATLNGQVKQLIFNANMRKYPNTLEAALDRTEVPTYVYHNLIDSVHNHMNSMYRYMELRKKLLHVDELHMYDVYTPIVADLDKVVSYEEAQSVVLEALKPFGEEYLKVVKRAFNERWIDVYENVGKRGGAYSAGGHPHPYMLLNYDNTLDAMFTLIHEMGHSMHTYLTVKNQPTVYGDYVIFVAEVASTCNEVLLMKYLLNQTKEPKQRAYLINHFLEQFRTTLYRQTMFAEFELIMNQKAEAGETLTAELLNQIYRDLNKLYYGPSVVCDPQIEKEWARIPHFYYNYYVFQYSTGFSAAVSLANKILNEGQPAVDAYLKFLSSGSSTDPISLLKIAGVDMSSTKPIDDALELFDSLITELGELLQ